MSEKKKLIKNTGILFFSKMCTQIISFLLLPLYTSYLTTSEYGFVDLAFTYISLFAPVITLQLEMAVFRFLIDVKEDEDKKKQIISTVMVLLIIISIIFIIIVIVLMLSFKVKYGLIILINIILTIFSNMFLQIARGFSKTKNYSIGVFITSSFTIVLNVIFIAFLKIGAVGLLISMAVSKLFSLIYLFLSLKIYKYIDRKLFSKKRAKELIKYSIPLVPNGISWWIINVSDRTMISSMLGTSSNGIYAVSNKFPTLFTNFTSIFNLAWTESASTNIDHKDRDSYFSDIINNTIQVFSSICLLIITVMPFIFPILVNEAYGQAYYYIPILLIASLVNSVVKLYSGIYVAKKLTKQVMNTSIIAAIINIVINLLLIHKIGIYAACLSTLIAYATMMVYRYFDLKKYITIHYDKKMITIIISALIVVTISYYINHVILNSIILLLAVLFILYFNKGIFETYFKKSRI